MYEKDNLPVPKRKKNSDMSPIVLVVLIRSTKFRALIFQLDIWIHCPRIRAINGNAKKKIIIIKDLFPYCHFFSFFTLKIPVHLLGHI